ncbi:hypothetical protein FPV67DRAFT_1668221 [Lyophyllum atratum]|nr:hypothetical protein FPV67DRAFT_1668221 [Lyophyllum atratum]
MLYDGIGYFVALAAVNVVNLILFKVRNWLDIQTAAASFAYTVSWIMSQRLLMHLHDASRERRNESIEEAITVTQHLDSARQISRAIRSQFEPKSGGGFDLTVPDFELGTDPGQAEPPEDLEVQILVVVSCISLLAVVVLLLAIALSAFNTRGSFDKHLFVRTHVAAYFVSLLLCDFIQVWVHRMGVYFGETCVLQGVLKQTSDIGTAVWTLVIAVHTFCLLFLELKTRAFVLWITLLGGWSAIAALVILGPATLNTERRGPFFGVSGYWCWISPNYPTQRITLDYLFMFLAAFMSFILYILIFLRFRGNVVRSGWRIRFRKANAAGSDGWPGRKFTDDQAVLIAKQMLL